MFLYGAKKKDILYYGCCCGGNKLYNGLVDWRVKKITNQRRKTIGGKEYAKLTKK